MAVNFLSELNPGDSAAIDVAITSIEEANTAYGSTYLTLNFRDLSNGPEYSAKMFKMSKAEFPYAEGDLCNLELDCKLYRGNVSFNVKGVNPVSDGLEKRDFAKHSPYNPQQMYDLTLQVLAKHRSPDGTVNATSVAETAYQRYADRLSYWPAAKSMHHACHGGLMYHQFRMTLVADRVTSLVNEYTSDKTQVPDAQEILRRYAKTSVSQLALDVSGMPRKNISTEAPDHSKLGWILRLGELTCQVYPMADVEMVLSGLYAYDYGKDWDTTASIMSSPEMGAVLAVDATVKKNPGKYNAEDIRLVKHCIGALPGADGNPSIRTAATMEAMICHSVMEMWKTISAMTFTADVPYLVAATAVHDIGKILELDSDEFGVGDYSVDGTLGTHLSLGCEMLSTIAEQIGCDQSSYVLLNLVASHHRKREWNAICAPETPAAKLLTAIDYLDSRMYVYEDEFNQLKAGEISTNSSVRFMLGSNVYRSSRYEDKEEVAK